MALEVFGGAFLSAGFQNLFDKIGSLDVIGFFQRKKLNERLLKRLKLHLLSANAVVVDAETKQLGDQLVRDWLHELNAATYDAEDLMIEIGDESLRCEMEEGEPSTGPTKVIDLASSLFGTANAFVAEIELKMEEVLDRLEFLVEQADALGLRKGAQNIPLPHSQRSPATSLVEESGVFGRDDEKRRILELLLSSDARCDAISVIPIVGMGGIGKTTLAGLVYNDDRVKAHFEVKAWVNVSEDFSVARVTKTILDRVAKWPACDVGDLDRLQVELKEALRGKKFLFVLDDVWNENYGKWDCLRRAFESGAKGSKIIVTTRNGRIASMMADPNVLPCNLKTISDNDCLKLFVRHTFSSNVALGLDPNMEILCKSVVERGNGLPMAVKSLAGLLRSEQNQEEWEKILQSDLWEFPSEKVEVIPALWLSYHYLPPHLKRCFAYCAIFPSDFKFKKQELIVLWVAENLLPRQKGKRPEEVGEDYFNDLVSRSMFQKCLATQELFNMHVLVRDLAKFVAGEFCTSLEDEDSHTSISNTIRHLSCGGKSICVLQKFEALSQAKLLHTLLVLGQYRPNEELVLKLLLKFPSLRVLSLSNYASTELPVSIGDLKHLRYLELSSSGLARLPNTVCNLYNLQILRLVYCRFLSRLPAKMGRLINLRHLDVRWTPLTDMPEDLGSLKNLEFLSDYVVGEGSGSNINQLQRLHHLHGKLRISELHNTGDVADITESLLKDKCLEELILEWDNRGNNYRERDRVLLDRLRPHTKLRKLDIKYYGGERFSEWLGDVSFSNIVTMSLQGCTNCRELPSLGQLPSLQELDIIGFARVARIGEEFYSDVSSSTTQPFRSLEALHFRDMLSLEEWSFRRVFPSLTRLIMSNCKQLATLASGPFPSLQRIEMRECASLESFLEFGSFSRLKSIEISGCLKMQWDFRRFTSLTSLELRGCNDAVDSFPEEGLLPTTLISLSISKFRNLNSLNSKSLQHLTSLESLTIWSCKTLERLPEEGLPNSLSFLHISNCPSLSTRCQRDNGEDWPKIAHISNVIINCE